MASEFLRKKAREQRKETALKIDRKYGSQYYGGSNFKPTPPTRLVAPETRPMEVETPPSRLANVFESAGAQTGASLLNLSGLATKGIETIDQWYKSNGSPEEQAQADIDKINAEKGIKDVYNEADKMANTAAQKEAQAKEGLGKVGRFAVDVGIGGTQLAGDVALAAATGGSALPFVGVRSFGSGTQKARQEGADIKQQLAYGAGTAATEVLTEKLLNVAKPFKKAFGSGVLDKAVSKAVGKFGQTAAGKAILSAGGEGMEEFVADVVEPVIRRATYDKDAKFDLEGALYDAMVGGTLGLVGATGDVVQTAREGRADKAAPAPATERTSISKEERDAHFKPVEKKTFNADKVADGKTTFETVWKNIMGDEAATQELETAMDSHKVGVDAENHLYKPNAEEHIDNREMGDVGKRNVKAFQYQNPELHPYYKSAAELLLSDVENSFKGGENVAHVSNDGNLYSTRLKRMTSPAVAYLLDTQKISYDRISDALDSIIKNHGHENYADAKRVELVLDDILSNGYKFLNQSVGPNQEYINLKQQIPGSQHSVYSTVDEYLSSPEAEADRALGATDEELTNEYNFKNVGSAEKGFDPYTGLQAEYGTIPEGEKAYRPDDMPAQTTPDDKVMRGARTTLGAEATPDARVKGIENMVVDGQFSYVPVKNQSRADAATAKIQRDGWDVALRDWTAAARAGKATPDNMAMGAVLLNNAGNSAANGKEYADLLIDYVNLSHTAGQALQANRILRTLSPEGKLYAIQRSVESLADDYKGKYDIEINPELIDSYRNAESDEQRDRIVDDIKQNIADQIPSTALDKWTALRYTNMLGNFKTQIRNVAGNTGMQVLRKTKDEIATAIELAANKATGGKVKRTKAFVANPQMFKAAWSDFKNVQDAAMGEAKYSDGSNQQIVSDIRKHQTVFKNNGTWGTGENANPALKAVRKTTDLGWKALEAYRKVTSDAMELGDMVFSRSAYADALAGYLQANGIKSIADADATLLDSARAYAIQEAQESTFRDDSWLAKQVEKLPRGAISQGILPFRRTPANILARAEEYSPLGLINTTVDAVKVKNGDATGADVINSLAKSMTGTGLLALGYVLAKAGIAFGAPDDDKKQASFDKLTGRQVYSIELPDGTSLTMDWASPESIPFFMGVELAEGALENGLQPKDIEQSLLSITNPMLEMSMLQGVNDTLENVSYSENPIVDLGIDAVVSFATQGLTNTLLGQLERSSEPDRMTTYTDKSKGLSTDWQYRIGRASAKTPGVDYDQTEYINEWGERQSNGDFGSRLMKNLFSPSYVSKHEMDATEKELQRLHDAGQNILPARPSRYITIDKKRIDLTAEQYTKYATMRGKRRKALLDTAVRIPAYKSMNDAEKKEFVEDVYTYTNEMAKGTVSKYASDLKWVNELNTKKGDRAKVDFIIQRTRYGSIVITDDYKEAVKAGISPETYAAYKDSNSTKKAEILREINNLDLTDAQKDTLYLQHGNWSKKKLWQTPWH